MKILAFITLFILSSCNVYDLVGLETSVSEEFKSTLPQITLDINRITLTSSNNSFSNNSIRLKISGGEQFTGTNGDNFKASGKVSYDALTTPLMGLDTSMTITKEDDYTIKIEFNNPSPELNTTTVPTEEIVNLYINPSAYTNNIGIPVNGTNQIFSFGP